MLGQHGLTFVLTAAIACGTLGCGKSEKSSDEKSPTAAKSSAKTPPRKTQSAKTIAFGPKGGPGDDQKLQPIEFNIPDRPVAGTLRGTKFQPDKAELDGSRLTLSSGSGFIPDATFDVSLQSFRSEEPVDGRTFEFNPPLEFGTPFASMRWKVPGKDFGENAMTNKYALKVVFGQRKGRRVEGRLHFKALSKGDENTEFAGTFTAEIGPDLNAPPTDLDAPFIHGGITVKGAKELKLSVSMIGMTQDRKRVGNGAGTTFTPGSGAFVASTTFKPQITAARSHNDGKITYRHIVLKPGSYLAYVTLQERLAAWQWIEVGENAKITHDFAIDAARKGKLEVQVDNPKPTVGVHLIPLNADGTAPESAEKMGIGFRLKLTQRPNAGKVVFDQLAAGRYRVLLGTMKNDVQVETGKTTVVTLP